jgi:putative hemolysin
MSMEPAALSSLYTSLIVFFVGLSARALFSFLETSITALRLFKLKELAASNSSYRALFTTLEKNPHRVLITILIANSLADVTTAAIATHIMETLFAHLNLSGNLGFSLGIGIATLAILIFGEIIPKNIAKGHGERLLPSTLWFANIVFYLFKPIVTFLMKISDFFVRKISDGRSIQDGAEWISSEKEIQFLIGYISEKGLMETEKTMMLQNIFELGRTPVKEILIPASDIVSVNATLTSFDTVDTFLKYGYTRLPVYENKIDNIIGMVYLKDVFALTAHNDHKPIKEIVRPIMFVPESMKVNQLLREFRQQHMHIAVVLNEHGSLIGLITLEDVLEEIVGDISDEHEMAAQNIVELKRNSWLVNGGTPLEELSHFFGIVFETEDSLTLGGFLTEKLQHLPKKGERILYQNLYFQVQKATPKRVLQVLVFKANTPLSSDKEQD